MKPVDVRNENWKTYRNRVAGLRELVWRQLYIHGPCTTRELATAAKLEILTVRPRVTELCQLGFADIISDRAGEGIYSAITEETALLRFQMAKERALAPPRQLPLALRS